MGNCDDFPVCNIKEKQCTCTCHQGFELKSGNDNFIDAATSRCVDYNECNVTTRCPSNSDCYNTIGSYYCMCKSGFSSSSGQANFSDIKVSCDDINECVGKGAVDCGTNALCNNTAGSYYCYCKTGYNSSSGNVTFMNKNKSTCQGIDECQRYKDVCGDHSICNNITGSYSCACQPGFSFSSGNNTFGCKDIDECQQDKDICGDHSICNNTIGSYSCACQPGFTSRTVTHQFTNASNSKCDDIDECQQDKDICGDHSICNNTIGSYSCACQPGFTSRTVTHQFTNASNSKCDDIDECLQVKDICGDHSICNNTIGSYSCACQPGFTSRTFTQHFTNASNSKCDDIDECQQDKDICGDHSICNNTIGSYSCACQPGFTSRTLTHQFTNASYSKCDDIDECQQDKDICGDHSICNNTIGSYSCACQPGFTSRTVTHQFTNASNSKCDDIDECQQDKDICGDHSICYNTIGSYSCACQPGFTSSTVSSTVTHQFTNASNSKCDGQQCQCCPELWNPNISKCSSRHFILTNRTKGSITKLVRTVEFNISSDTPSNVKQEKITTLLREVEEFILNDVLSSLNKNATKEEIKYYNSNETEIFAYHVPFSSSYGEKMLTLTVENVTMGINSKTVTNGTETGTPPFAMLTSVHGSEIESLLSDGYIIDQNTSSMRYNVNSKVVIATISSKFKFNLKDPVTFIFQKKEINKQKPSICVFWKTDEKNRSGWSTEGCSEENTNTTHITCKCNHLSSFSVLMALDETLQDETPLAIISYIGLTLSVICLVISVLTFWLCHSIKNVTTTQLLNLCVSLLVADVIFLFGISRTSNEKLCRAIAVFLHYFFLACFCWMCLGALQLYLKVQHLKAVSVFRTHVMRRKYLYPVGYGLPAIIVAISAAISPQHYGTKKLCWLEIKSGFIWSFMGPVCFIVLVNIFLFSKTIYTLQQHFSSLNKDVSTIKNTKVLLFKAIAQFLVLGCTWIFGIFQFRQEMLFMSYLFTLLNSFHGIFMFLLYCVANKLVLDEYKKKFQYLFRRKKKEQDFTTTSSTAATFMIVSSHTGEAASKVSWN
ncbi:adhesion G protein-coupled receptor E1-like [Protopterus annectens]|uniref:adhesion G protein-coupled receptor E1-like n=1 Tax=Protopterus annectens TaxID=7888 RepID=UPI001CFB1C6D|nr:adhesion G protein-coupled receptor E1-like [Protopterus annectens]